jgi:hypothetical protein
MINAAHRDVWRETALVADVDRILAVLLLDHGLERLVALRADLHGLTEGGGAHWHEHELLEREVVASVAASVDHIEGWHRKDELGVAGEVSEVLVERHALGGGTRLRDRQGDTQNGVGAEAALVRGAVQVDHCLVDLALVHRVHALDALSDLRVDVVHRVQDSLALAPGASIAQLVSLHTYQNTKRKGGK